MLKLDAYINLQVFMFPLALISQIFVWTSAARLATVMATIDAGVKAGLSYQLGGQTNRVGVTVGSYARSNDTSTEAFFNWSGYRQLSHIETPEAGWQQQVTAGVTQGFGSVRSLPTRAGEQDWSVAANNTGRNYSVSAYTTVYQDTYQTSQSLLGLGLNMGRINVRFENDYDPFGLLGDGEDRFRTGALEVGYRGEDDTNYVVGFNAFTGDARAGKLEADESGQLGPNGSYSLEYDDGSPVEAAERSTGAIYAGVRNWNLTSEADALGLDNMQLRLGWSSDNIRAAVQNAFHDVIGNPRVPPRERTGKPYVQFGTNQGQPLYP